MILSKVLTQLVFPLNLSLLGIFFAAILILSKKRKVGKGILVASLAWLWIWSTPAFSGWVRNTLENAYPPRPVEEMETADAIVVLGGAMGAAIPPRIYPDLGAAADRGWHAARLYKAGKAPLIIISGGQSVWAADNTAPESISMSLFVKDFGIPESAIVLESESRNTYENAMYVKRICAARGIDKILLVTSALHMFRAEAQFLYFNIHSIPAATDFEMVACEQRFPASWLLSWLPNALSLEGGSQALKEYIGVFFLYFKMAIKTQAPFMFEDLNQLPLAP